jgi:hypothetical protein
MSAELVPPLEEPRPALAVVPARRLDPVRHIIGQAERLAKREPVTLAVVPYCGTPGSVKILAALQKRDKSSLVFLPRGPWRAIQEAWPAALLVAKQVVVVPSLANEIGSGAVWQIAEARAAGVPTFAFDRRSRQYPSSRFEVEPIEGGTMNLHARLVFVDAP